jgi:ABC-type bacteriocin/lantibiotic exporter with double-glycine peptidase domain
MIKNFNKYHFQQNDQSDCGVICLSSILSYCNSYYPLEELRELSGTNKGGATMLGLIQCARKIGFDADGYEADIKNLKECQDIAILHFIKDKILQHYVVCFGYSQQKQAFIISDPAKKSIEYLNVENVENLWKSKALILVKPTNKLETTVKQPSKYRWVLSYLKQDANIITMAFILGIIIAILSISSAIFSQKFIDSLLPSNNFNKVIFGSILLLFLLLLSAFLGYIKQLFLIRQGKDFNIRIIKYFYTKLMCLPKLFFDTRRIGDLTARMNDTNRIQNTITSFISNIIIHLLTVLVSSIAIFSYNWKLGIFSLLWLPILALVVWYFHPKIIVGQKEVMQNYAQNESNYIDTIKGIDVIKSTNTQDIFSFLTLGLFTNYRNKVYDLGKISIQYQFILQTSGSFFIVGIILYGSYLAYINEFTSGGVIALIQLSSMLMGSAIGIASLNIQLQEANIALNRMFEYTAIKEEVNNNPQNIIIKNIESIKLNNISFGYIGRKTILNNISLEINKGECIGITGEIGTGKSTLLYLLQKFHNPNKGKIMINNDIDLNTINTKEWRSNVGVVPQDTHIFNGSVIQNIAFDVNEKNIDSIIDFFNQYMFSTFIEQLPQSYATIIGEEGINLSGGQKQVIALMRAIYKKPKVLLLDEFTSAMDRKTEEFVINLIKRLKSELTIIFISHRIQSLPKIADRIYVLENGTISSFGDHEKLLKSKNFYSEFWTELQTE